MRNAYYVGTLDFPSGVDTYGGLFGHLQTATSVADLDALLYAAQFPVGETEQAANKNGDGDLTGYDLQAVTDNELQSSATYEGESALVAWDFVDTWNLDPATNAGYPYLLNNLPQAQDN